MCVCISYSAASHTFLFSFLHESACRHVVCLAQKSGGSSSSGNGGGAVQKNADGSMTYQDPLDAYCDDNPETDECRYAPTANMALYLQESCHSIYCIGVMFNIQEIGMWTRRVGLFSTKLMGLRCLTSQPEVLSSIHPWSVTYTQLVIV